MSVENTTDNPKDLEEYRALSSVLSAHVKYGQWAKSTVLNPKKLKWASLTKEEQSLLPWFPEYLQILDWSISNNAQFFQDVALKTAEGWGAQTDQPSWFNATPQDLDKVRGLMIQYTREWSELGAGEREASMGRILKTCEELYPDVERRQNVEVLVPGAGLGRLVVEFVGRGFRTQGNEVSYHMLLNSSFVLNSTYCTNEFCLCPFIHKGSNVAKRNYQVQQVYIPDFLPGDVSRINIEHPTVPVGDLMSMVAGSFVDLYGPVDLGKINDSYTQDKQATEFRQTISNHFHVVATCFFLDTASNVIDYIKTIKNCLRNDGYWINFGPLLWHHEDDDTVINTTIVEHGVSKTVPTPAKGLELSREDLIQLIQDMGFEFVKHESDIETAYGGDPKSLGGWYYKSEFWVCKLKDNL